MAKLLDQIIEAAREAGQIMLEAKDVRETIMAKDGHANFVTAYDQRVQAFLIGRLSEILPEANFLGEEEGKNAFLPEYERGFLFVIDPIDGTSNFSQGLFPSVTSIGLLLDGEPEIGVIYNPYSDEMFYAKRGEGAFCNGEPIHSLTLPLSKSLVSFGTAPYDPTLWDKSFGTARSYISRCIDIRRSGSAAWDLCMVASGHIGLFLEPVLQIYDFAAGAVILTEAGGRITDWSGSPVSFRGPSSIVAVSEGVSREEYLPDIHEGPPI